MARTLPSGQVTFAFTDVVGSTRAFTEHGDRYVAAVQRVQERVARHTVLHGGAVVKTEGDGAMLAFPSARAAVDALVAMQVEMEEQPENGGLHLRIRAGAHTGHAEPVGEDYLALPVHVAARVGGTAGAGQVVVSQAVVDDLADPGGAMKVGTYALKDVSEPMALWRVVGDDAPLSAVPARRTNVAQPYTTFVGRESELLELFELLRVARLVTVVGTGGLGKTRLVSEFALKQAADVAAGVWLVELASLSAGDEVVPEVARFLGLAGSSAYELVAAELARRGEIVLVLDNCEHLAETVAELVADLLADAPRARLVCTSREPLEVDGERVMRLGPMPVRDGSGAAEELFRQRAEVAGASLVPTDGQAVAELCRVLDGIPLAVELAAARSATMPVAELASALAGGQVELRRRGGDPRQRDLGALVAWSLERIAPAEQEALFALSVLPGRFTLDMAAAVLTAATPGVGVGTVAELVRRSLIDLDGSEYRMLATVASVTRTALERRSDLRGRAMAGLCTWAVEVSDPSARREESTLAPDHLRAMEVAFDWAMEHELAGRGWILKRLTRWAVEHSISARTRSWALAILDQPLVADADVVRLNIGALFLCRGTAITSAGSGFVDRALDVLSLARHLGDPVLGPAAHCAAFIMVSAGRYDDAERLSVEAAELLRDTPRSMGSVYLDLGACHHLAGRLQAAEENYRRALAVLDAYPADYNRLACLVNLGEVMLDRGRAAEAATRLRGVLDETLGRPAARAYVLALLAEAEHRSGSTERAAAIAREAESAFEPLVEHDPSLDPARERMRAALTAPEPPAQAAAAAGSGGERES